MTKLYVLTGFLGAGKTTILLKILEELKGQRIGVIQNEFGKLGIDGEILRTDGVEMVEINKGSIFCSCLKLNFVKALTEMGRQHFEYLFVESSGLGDPSNIEEILHVVKATSQSEYQFCGVICLVDAVNFLHQIGDLETVNRQLKHCHMAVITKTDLVDSTRLAELESKIQEINPVCKIEYSANGSLALTFLSENLLQRQWAESEETTNREETKPKTLFMNCKEPFEKERFEDFIKAIHKEVYRIKGFAELSGEGWRQVDVVGDRLDYKVTEPKDMAQLVVISKVGPAVIRPLIESWKTYVGTRMELKN